MLTTVFATKLGMTQAWTKAGKRVAVTRCQVKDNVVLGEQKPASLSNSPQPLHIFEIGYGPKKLKNMTKPLRSSLQKSGFSFGVKQIQGVKVAEEAGVKVGDTIKLDQVLAVGDVVRVQGITKGRGFTGAVKRHGFQGGPRTHGQSDRERAVGSIGAGTTPGRVFKGKRMAGHYGVETRTVANLVVLHADAQTGEVWLSGPVPGFNSSTVRIEKTGTTKTMMLHLPEVEVKAESAAA